MEYRKIKIYKGYGIYIDTDDYLFISFYYVFIPSTITMVRYNSIEECISYLDSLDN